MGLNALLDYLRNIAKQASINTESQSEKSANTTTKNHEEIGNAIISASQFAWNWFWDAKEIDLSDSVIGELYGTEFNFYAVTADGVNSKESLRELTHNYFTYDITDEMMSYKGWVEQNGKLYVSETFGLGGVAPDALYISVNKVSDINYEIIVYELSFQGKPSETLSDPIIMHYLWEDGHWVFDTILCYMGKSIPVYPYESGL